MESKVNQGSVWNEEEETTLLQELALNETVEEIAKKHARSIGAIRARQNHLARRMVLEQGFTVEEAAHRVRTNVHSVQQSLDASKKSLTNAQKRHNYVEVKKEETPLSVMMEIRDLMRQMVANQVKIMNSLD